MKRRLYARLAWWLCWKWVMPKTNAEMRQKLNCCVARYKPYKVEDLLGRELYDWEKNMLAGADLKGLNPKVRDRLLDCGMQQ